MLLFFYGAKLLKKTTYDALKLKNEEIIVSKWDKVAEKRRNKLKEQQINDSSSTKTITKALSIRMTVFVIVFILHLNP